MSSAFTACPVVPLGMLANSTRLLIRLPTLASASAFVNRARLIDHPLSFAFQEFFQLWKRAVFHKLEFLKPLALGKAVIAQTGISVAAAIRANQPAAALTFDPVAIRVSYESHHRLAARMRTFERFDAAAQGAATDFASHTSPSFPGNPITDAHRRTNDQRAGSVLVVKHPVKLAL